jgi:hypothetical protein
LRFWAAATAVPEPGTFFLLSAAAFVVAGLRWRSAGP